MRLEDTRDLLVQGDQPDLRLHELRMVDEKVEGLVRDVRLEPVAVDAGGDGSHGTAAPKAPCEGAALTSEEQAASGQSPNQHEAN